MFVQADLPVDLPFEDAVGALERIMADGGLTSESRRAIADGLQFVMPVGPRGSRFPERDVIVQLLPGRRIGRRLFVAVRWKTTGPTGRMFPALDADLELTDGEDHTSSILSIVARYHPPLGTIGQTLDRVVMSRVAEATMTALLRQVAARLHN